MTEANNWVARELGVGAGVLWFFLAAAIFCHREVEVLHEHLAEDCDDDEWCWCGVIGWVGAFGMAFMVSVCPFTAMLIWMPGAMLSAFMHHASEEHVYAVYAVLGVFVDWPLPEPTQKPATVNDDQPGDA